MFSFLKGRTGNDGEVGRLITNHLRNHQKIITQPEQGRLRRQRRRYTGRRKACWASPGSSHTPVQS